MYRFIDVYIYIYICYFCFRFCLFVICARSLNVTETPGSSFKNIYHDMYNDNKTKIWNIKLQQYKKYTFGL